MVDSGCEQAMELLNAVFGSGIILNDGHEIHARLEAGDDLAAVAEEFGGKLGSPIAAAALSRTMETWPPLQLEAVSEMVRWGLGKLDTEDRVTIVWKGDANHHETVTRFEVRDNKLLIEFAHPPAEVAALS